jgi:hypothetical protein
MNTGVASWGRRAGGGGEREGAGEPLGRGEREGAGEPLTMACRIRIYHLCIRRSVHTTDHLRSLDRPQHPPPTR